MRDNLNNSVCCIRLDGLALRLPDGAKKALGYAEFLKTPNFLFYVQSFQDIVEKLQPLSLEFQKEELRVCHVPSKVEETKAMVDVLYDVSGEIYSCLLQGLKDDGNDRYLVYQDKVLKKPTGRRAPDINNTSGKVSRMFF